MAAAGGDGARECVSAQENEEVRFGLRFLFYMSCCFKRSVKVYIPLF